jgi:glycerate 2-kinase
LSGMKINGVRFTVLCDVDNPLIGPRGAAEVYAHQKGADDSSVRLLEQGTKHFASIVKENFNINLDFSGAGAAGGMGAGSKFFLNATLLSGIDYIMHEAGLDELIRKADLVITGEGRLDEQTLSGKVVRGITELCSKYQKPVWVVTGKNNLSDSAVRSMNISKVIALVSDEVSEQQAMDNAYSILSEKVRFAFRDRLQP